MRSSNRDGSPKCPCARIAHVKEQLEAALASTEDAQRHGVLMQQIEQLGVWLKELGCTDRKTGADGQRAKRLAIRRILKQLDTFRLPTSGKRDLIRVKKERKLKRRAKCRAFRQQQYTQRDTDERNTSGNNDQPTTWELMERYTTGGRALATA